MLLITLINAAQMRQRAPAAGQAARLLHQNTPQKIDCAAAHFHWPSLGATAHCGHGRHAPPPFFSRILSHVWGGWSWDGGCILGLHSEMPSTPQLSGTGPDFGLCGRSRGANPQGQSEDPPAFRRFAHGFAVAFVRSSAVLGIGVP